MKNQQSLANSSTRRQLNNSRSQLGQSRNKLKPNHARKGEKNKQNATFWEGKSIDESLLQLQDPKFISDQIQSFQSKLPSNNVSKGKGFCKVTRQQSLLLSNTQGYRKYKNQIKSQKLKTQQRKEKDLMQIEKKSQKVSIKTEQVGGEKRVQTHQSSSSLCYSNQSRENARKRSPDREKDKDSLAFTDSLSHINKSSLQQIKFSS